MPERTAFGDVETRVLLAHLAGRTTVRGLASDLHVGHYRVREALWVLRHAGLLSWPDGTRGTRHALVRPVALMPSGTIGS